MALCPSKAFHAFLVDPEIRDAKEICRRLTAFDRSFSSLSGKSVWSTTPGVTQSIGKVDARPSKQRKYRQDSARIGLRLFVPRLMLRSRQKLSGGRLQRHTENSRDWPDDKVGKYLVCLGRTAAAIPDLALDPGPTVDASSRGEGRGKKWEGTGNFATREVAAGGVFNRTSIDCHFYLV